MRLTWRTQPHEPYGLKTGTSFPEPENPRGLILKANGTDVGRACSAFDGQDQIYWYWTASVPGIILCSSGETKFHSLDEAKEECEAYVRQRILELA